MKIDDKVRLIRDHREEPKQPGSRKPLILPAGTEGVITRDFSDQNVPFYDVRFCPTNTLGIGSITVCVEPDNLRLADDPELDLSLLGEPDDDLTLAQAVTDAMHEYDTAVENVRRLMMDKTWSVPQGGNWKEAIQERDEAQEEVWKIKAVASSARQRRKRLHDKVIQAIAPPLHGPPSDDDIPF